MLHRLRAVLVRPGRDRLTGTVEVDETYIGGEEPGLRGGRAKGKKVLVGIAVEVHEPSGFGRCRMAMLADASAASLHPFVTDNVEPGAHRDHRRLDGLPRASRGSATPTSGAASGPPGPAARTPASCCPACTGSPRWPSGGCWAPTRARSTRRTCRATSTSSSSGSTAAARAARGMVFYRVLRTRRRHTHPVRYRDLVADPQTQGASRHGRRPGEAIRRAWTVHSPTAPGARFQAR